MILSKTKQHSILKAEQLEIGYCTKSGVNPICQNIDIDLEKGKLVCLLGKNGIGKSTLLRTLSKTQYRLSGSIFINQKELSTIAPTDLAKKMGLVLTEKIPDSQLTVFELVALGRQPYTNWLGKLSSKDYELTHKALVQVGIEEIADNKYYELSDGQLQKVMIARALAQDTEIIILDEPTAHLDIHHKIEVFTLLQKLVKETGKTIILSTHEVNLAIKIADVLWLMTSEKFVSGKLQEHISQKNFEELFPTTQIEFDRNTEQFILKK
ncbi:ABC transporter ATP-binding protein [Bacteroidota bacterium]